MKKNSGFTLIEILIALFIFAILGTLAAIGLRSVSNTYQRIEAIHHQLHELAFATILMRRDFLQLIKRSITSTSGYEMPPLIINSTNDLEFTTSGFSNPGASETRSTFLRVGYQLQHHNLIRLTWSVLDRPPHILAQQRVLLHHVTHLSFTYVDEHGQLMNAWTTNTIVSLPHAVIAHLTIEHLGTWEGVFPIVGRGYDN